MSAPDAPEPPFQVIVVLYNDAKWIAACLDAIARADGPATETWVVDNASADGGAEVVERGYPWAKLARRSVPPKLDSVAGAGTTRTGRPASRKARVACPSPGNRHSGSIVAGKPRPRP